MYADERFIITLVSMSREAMHRLIKLSLIALRWDATRNPRMNNRIDKTNSAEYSYIVQSPEISDTPQSHETEYGKKSIVIVKVVLNIVNPNSRLNARTHNFYTVFQSDRLDSCRLDRIECRIQLYNLLTAYVRENAYQANSQKPYVLIDNFERISTQPLRTKVVWLHKEAWASGHHDQISPTLECPHDLLEKLALILFSSDSVDKTPNPVFRSFFHSHGLGSVISMRATKEGICSKYFLPQAHKLFLFLSTPSCGNVTPF
ncbi:hypothetical protein Ciccas_011252 [Cichlidogyrus casuarinus]|uniref:Uncharacterized protein n=1 Tax=Cichlidogyrus casuarinus TaxID=1844966 RepID=A0ABD2PRS8_9PLAT